MCVTDVNGELPILPQIDGELPEGAYAVYENADTSASGVSGAEAAVFTREGYEMLRLSVTVIALDPQTLWQIPGSFAIIESEAFAGMNVSYLAVPAGVMLIEENAFADCPLTAVFVQSRETRIASDAFGGAYVTYAYDEYLKWADKR